MSCRFSLALAASAALCALVAPSALAAGDAAHHKCAPPPPSAVNVYVEQVYTACGSSTPTRKAHTPVKHTVQPGGQPAPNATPAGSVKPRVHPKSGKPHHVKPGMSAQTHHVTRPLPLTRAALRQPSAVGAAFDLGSGPTILFASLLAAAALLAVGGGFLRRRG